MLYVNVDVKFEGGDDVYNVLLPEGTKEPIGRIIFYHFFKEWFFQAGEEYMIGPKTLQQITNQLLVADALKKQNERGTK